MSDLLNTPEGGLDEAIRVGKTYFRELRQERDQLRAEVERLQRALDVRGEIVTSQNLERERIVVEAQANCDAATARAEAAESTVAGLRRALEVAVDEVQTIAYGKEGDVKNDFTSVESHGWGMAYLHLCGIVGPALAASSDEHERRIKAERLRRTAAELEVLRDYIQTEVGPDDARDDIRRVCWNRAKDLREEANRLDAMEKEGKG